MSFVRRGRPSYLTNNRQKKKRNAIKKKPAWDDSLTDLNVYRANAADLEYRKAVHQSKHLPSIKFQREKKAALKDELLTTLGKLNPKQLGIMKEILYNQDELQTVLNYSDKLMERVEDVCGDNPKRYLAFPSVTSASGSDAEATFKTNLPSELPEYQSRLDLLSNQVMSSTALNDEQESQVEDSPPTTTYTSQIDMECFRRLLAAEEENLKNACATPKQQNICSKIQTDCESELVDEGLATPETRMFGRPISAANDTKKVNRVRKVIAEDSAPSETQIVLDGTAPSALKLSDLKKLYPKMIVSQVKTADKHQYLQAYKVLEELQSEMTLYEQNTGTVTAEKEHRETFSGYTMALLNSVIKLSRYLRQTEEKLQTEKIARELLTGQVSDLKIIVDALTADLIQTQETNQNLESELRIYQQKMEHEILLLKRHTRLLLSEDVEEGVFPPTSSPPPVSTTSAATVEPQSQPLIPTSTAPTSDQYSMETANSIIRKTKSLDPEKTHDNSCFIVNKQIEPFLTDFQPAFQLSPPVQKTRIFTQNGTERQVSLVGIDDLALSMPSQSCQLPCSKRIPSIPSSELQTISKQPAANIFIPKPIPLGDRSQKVSMSNANAEDITRKCPLDGTENGQPDPEHAEEFVSTNDHIVGTKEMDRTAMFFQIQELNKQHEEAERVLRMLLQSDPHFGTGISPELAPEVSSSVQLQQVHSEGNSYYRQQDIRSSISFTNSPNISPVPNFPQDQTTDPQSPDFSITV